MCHIFVAVKATLFKFGTHVERGLLLPNWPQVGLSIQFFWKSWDPSIAHERMKIVFSILVYMWGGAVWVFSVDRPMVTSWLVNIPVTSGLSAVMYRLVVSVVVGLAAPKHPSQVIGISAGISFPVGILLPVWIPFPVWGAYLNLPASAMVTRWRARGGWGMHLEPEMEFRPEVEFRQERIYRQRYR